MTGTEAGDEPTAAASKPPEDEHAELERLRAEVAELRNRPAPVARRFRWGWRAPVASFLIIVGCLFAPLSVVAVWTANQVSDTSRYVANVEPLIHEPAIQNALTDQITDQITSNLDVAGLAGEAANVLTNKGLPRVGTLLRTFAPSLASAVNGFIHSTVNEIVTSPQFARTWVRANTVAHQALVTALSGRKGAVSVTNGQVTIDLAPFINVVKKDLSSRGFTLVNNLPEIHPSFVLFSSRELDRAQAVYRLINDLKYVLPILSLALIAAGVLVARGRRRALIGAGLGFAASMLVLGAGLAIFRSIYLNSVPSDVLPSNAAAVMYDTLVRFIKDALRVLMVAGLVVAGGAFFTGPSVTAVRTRQAITSWLGWLRATGEHAGLRTGPAGRWTYTHRTGLRVAAVALAAVVFVFWSEPTALVVIVIVIVLLVVLGLIELIGRPPGPAKTVTQHSG